MSAGSGFVGGEVAGHGREEPLRDRRPVGVDDMGRTRPPRAVVPNNELLSHTVANSAEPASKGT